MAVITLAIGADVKKWKPGSLQISKTANDRATAVFDLDSDGSYRPALRAEVLIVEDSVPVFAGTIDRVTERGLVQGYKANIVVECSCVDHNALPERRVVNTTFPEETLKTRLTTIVATYLDDFGVTLDAGQVDGPTLPLRTYTLVGLTEVLNDTMTLTAEAGEPFLWRIDDTKVLLAAQPSTVNAPFDITSNTPAEVVGDIEMQTSMDDFANAVYVQGPTTQANNREETFTGDGAEDTFTLQYTMSSNRGKVIVNGVEESLGDSQTWTFDANTNSITRTSAPDLGAPISITFDGVYTPFAEAVDAASIASVGLYEKVVRVDAIDTDETIQSIADAHLARSLAVGSTVTYRTMEDGLEVGQTQTVNVTLRNTNATAVITQISIRDLGKDRLIKDVTAVIDSSQTNLGRGYRDVYKNWSNDTVGSGSSIQQPVTVSNPPNQSGPGTPDQAVQFNRAGVFGGDAEFTYDETTNSIVMGGGGSDITATGAESCVVFGYDCHIIDP